MRAARRLFRWVAEGEKVYRSERSGLIQFGSRVELCLPITAKIHVKPDGRVTGGATIVPSFA